jgi:hypothetical protein
MPPSGYEEFQQNYEAESDREAAAFSKMSVPALLQIWPAIAEKATLGRAL